MISLAKNLKLVTFPLIIFVIASLFTHIDFVPSAQYKPHFEEDQYDSLETEIKLEINELIENNTWGTPIRVTTPDIKRGAVVSAQDNSGIYHSIWVNEFSPNELALSYSYTTNSSGKEWNNKSTIIHTQADISDLNLIIDENNTLHLSYIASKQGLCRIYYLNKAESNDTWSTERIIYSDYKNKLFNLKSIITNNKTVHYIWISEEQSYLENFNSTSFLSYFSFTSTIDFVTLEFEILGNVENPILASLTANRAGILQLFWMNRSSMVPELMSLFQTNSSDFGNSWSESSLITHSI